MNPVATLLRHWRAYCAVLVLCLLAGLVATLQQETRYESTATIGLTPGTNAKSIDSMGQLAVAAPLYTEAVESSELRRRARVRAPSGTTLGEVRVESFRETPVVFKIVASASNAKDAQATASAYGAALQAFAQDGHLLAPELAQVRIVSGANLPEDQVQPRPALTMFASLGVAVALGGLITYLRESAERRGTRGRHRDPSLADLPVYGVDGEAVPSAQRHPGTGWGTTPTGSSTQAAGIADRLRSRPRSLSGSAPAATMHAEDTPTQEIEIIRTPGSAPPKDREGISRRL